MKNLKMNLVLGFGVVALSSVLSQAAPVQSANELIVRLRNNPSAHAMNALEIHNSLNGADSGIKSVKVLTGSEGLVKLSFASPEQANLARARLQFTNSVDQVVTNHYYRPSVTYTFRDVAPAAQAPKPFMLMPDENILSGNVPEVLLPTGSVTQGVDPLVAKDWALKNIRMPAFTGIDSALTGTQPITAAVIDTGVDYNHEDLIGAMWRKAGDAKEVGYDFAHNTARPFDIVKFDVEGCLKDSLCSIGFNQGKFLANPGHGTHCAGHVGAVANNSLGMQGIASNRTQVMGLKFFYDAEDEHAGQGDDAAAIQSIDYAIKNGAKVISASWGGRMSRSEAEKSELKQALVRAQLAGVIVVIAAGNDAVDQDEVSDPAYPAAYNLDNLIVVAATDSADKLAKFSSYGAESVHIAAPGVKILSTTSGGKYNDVIVKFKTPQGKEQQIDWDGTSMATPIVAGAVAAVWAKFPAEDYRQIRNRILSTARAVPALAGKVKTGGLLDVSAALGI